MLIGETVRLTRILMLLLKTLFKMQRESRRHSLKNGLRVRALKMSHSQFVED